MLGEELREAILDLERARTKERTLRLESESLLEGLQMLSLSDNSNEVFRKLIEVLRPPLQFQDAMIICQESDSTKFLPVISTSPFLAQSEWLPQKSFQRVLKGRSLLSFDIRYIAEWDKQSEETKQNVTSAIHISFQNRSTKSIFICTHSQQGFFTRNQLQLSKRLVLLASKALVQIELRAENEMREKLFSFSTQMLGIMDLSGRFKQLNPAWSHTLSLSHQELLESSLPALLHPDERMQMRKALHALIEGQRASISMEARCIRKNGQYDWFLWSINTSIEEQQIYVIAQDISKHKRIEHITQLNEELKKARDAALNANQMKSLFLANMSHELRTPLSTIIGYTDLLTEEMEEEENIEFIDDLSKIHGAAEHLLLLINNILDLTKIESGKMELYYEAISLKKFLEELSDMFDPIIKKNNNQFSIIHTHKEDMFQTDLVRLRQVLVNLLSNACKFTKNGKIELIVQEKHDEKGKWKVFEVHDTGIGMTKEESKRIFEEFAQADISTTRKFGGTGLGLTLSQRICALMDGHLLVESTPLKGSIFTAKLPVK